MLCVCGVFVIGFGGCLGVLSGCDLLVIGFRVFVWYWCVWGLL